MRYKRKWETVIKGSTYRMSVPGGWLVSDTGEGDKIAMCFLPDPLFDWILEDEEED